MIRIFSTLALLCASIASISAQNVWASSTAPATGRVIVQLQGSPLAADSALKAATRATLYRYRLDQSLPPAVWYTKRLTDYQNQELQYLQSQGFDLNVGSTLHVVFNGFTARIPLSQIPRLRKAANVVSVTMQRRARPLLDTSVPLVNAPAAWASLGGAPTAGRGEMILQMDTGIDTSNPCFSDKNMPAPPFALRADTSENRAYVNNKVIVARAFGTYPKRTFSARDAEGHGTFGAAIEACDYNTPTPAGSKVTGMAPAAYLMNYNVFPAGDDGNGPDDNLLHALEVASQDGPDVINMSIGFPYTQGVYRLDPYEQAVDNLTRAGFPVVVSAGNAGPTTQTVSSPAGAPSAIAVGATSNSRGLFSSVEVNGPGPVPDSLARIYAKQGDAEFLQQKVGPAHVATAGYGRMPGDDKRDPNANDFAGVDLKGKIALIERGSPTETPILVATKAKNAASKGAVGVIIYDNNPTDPHALTLTAGAETIPFMEIDNADGKALLAWVQAHADATVTMNPATSAVPLAPDVLSDFSSRGYGLSYGIKPDLVAPGEEIYSATDSTDKNGDVYNPSGFGVADGTSFSAPHVTGAVALLEQKHLKQPNWTPQSIKAVLMQTANMSVYLDQAHTQAPGVMDIGGGRLDVGAAINAPAYVMPQSLSFGGVNDGSGAIHTSSTLTLGDLGAGAGSWQVSVRALHSGSGVSVSIPASNNVAAGAKTDLSVQLSVAQGAPAGDYDGYIWFTHGSQSLHVPYFVHVSSVSIKPKSVLLVDDTTSRYRATYGHEPVSHVDVTRYYESALSAIGKTYTYWDEAKQGSPTLQDMKQASAVILYTGTNLNALTFQNWNTESAQGPLSTVDEQSIDAYLQQGGHVFVTGMGVALSDPAWTIFVLGAAASTFSLFDTTVEDPLLKGGVSPPQPTVSPELGVAALQKVGPFSGLKSVDFSTKGDGAGTNLAVYNAGLQDFVGVAPLKAFNLKAPGYGTAYGTPALQAGLKYGHQDVGVVNGAEPSLKQPKVGYTGRSVFFSFGFEGINDNTGFATREQVLQRIFQWFDDKPTVTVRARTFRAGAKSTLTATLHANAPAKAGAYAWQIGSRTLRATVGNTHYTFPHAGRYRVRVQVTDTIGHTAVSPWASVTAR